MNRALRFVSAALLATCLVTILVGSRIATALRAEPHGSEEQSRVAWLVARFVGADLNRYSLRVDPPLARAAVDVWWTAEVNPRPVALIVAGRLVRQTPSEYGHNDFIVCYQRRAITAFGHFKTNWNHFHSYALALRRGPAGEVTADASAVGPDKLWVADPTEPALQGRSYELVVDPSGVCAHAE